MGTKFQKSVSRVKSGVELMRRLSRAAAQKLVRPHVGFEAFVEPLAELMEEFGDEIGRGGIDVGAMRAALATYQNLAAKRAEAVAQLALIDDTRLVASSLVWKQELLIYGHARQGARTNDAIAAMIDKFRSFLKHRKRRQAAPAAVVAKPAA